MKTLQDTLAELGFNAQHTEMGATPSEGFPVIYYGGVVTDDAQAWLDELDAREHQPHVPLAAGGGDHTQNLLVLDDELATVSTVRNVIDGQAYLHAFVYESAADLEQGIALQAVAEHARAEA